MLRLTSLILCFLYCHLFSFAFGAEETDNVNELYSKAISEKNGNKEIAGKLEEAYLKMEKEHPSIQNRIRLANIIAIKAKFTSFFLTRAGLVNKSIAAFESVEKEITPDTNKTVLYEFHLFRGRTFYKLPSIFGRKSIAKKDIEYAVHHMPDDRDNGEKARLFATYALALEEDNKEMEAKEFAKRAMSLNALEEADAKSIKHLLLYKV